MEMVNSSSLSSSLYNDYYALPEFSVSLNSGEESLFTNVVKNDKGLITEAFVIDLFSVFLPFIFIIIKILYYYKYILNPFPFISKRSFAFSFTN